MAHLVHQVEVVHNSPTTPHWPVRLTLKATSWGHRVLARQRPKPFPRRRQWDRNARRSTSIGPWRQRRPPKTWSRHGWSGCERRRLLGAAPTTSLELGAGPSWGDTRGWSLSTCPLPRRRARTPGKLSTKRQRHDARSGASWPRQWATWLLGGTGGHFSTRRNAQFEQSPQYRCPILAPGWEFPSQEALAPALHGAVTSENWTDLVRRVMLFHHEPHAARSMILRPNPHGAGDGRKKHAGARQALGMPSPRSASTMASTARSRGRSCWSSKWGHGCHCGWTGAGRTPSGSAIRRIGRTRCHDPHCKRSTMCGRRTRARRAWDTTASPPRPFCSSLVNCTRASSICSWPSRPSWAHMTVLRPKPSGEASHKWPHRCSVACSVPLTQAAGAKVGERARCSLFLGLPGQGVRSRGLGALDHGGGSTGAPAVGGFAAFGLGQVLRARWARSPLGGGPQNRLPKATAGQLVRFLRRLAFIGSRQVCNFPSYVFGTILRGCSGATTAAKLMLATLLETVTSRLPTYKLWNVVDDISGHVAGSPGWFRSPLPQRPGSWWWAYRPPRASPRIPSTARTSSSRATVGGALGRRVRFGTQRGGRFAAGQAAAGARRQGAAGEGCKENEARQAAAQGRCTHQQAYPHWLECWGCRGVPRFWASLQHSSKPSESMRPKPLVGSVVERKRPQPWVAHDQASGAKNIDPATRHHRQVVLAWATGVWEGTPYRPRCEGPLPGSVTSSGRGAAPPTRSISCWWRQRRWVSGWIRLH